MIGHDWVPDSHEYQGDKYIAWKCSKCGWTVVTTPNEKKPTKDIGFSCEERQIEFVHES